MRYEETFGDQTHIINLTRQLIGERTVAKHVASQIVALPSTFYALLCGRIRTKLKGVTNEKLGEIGCYGHNKDMGEPLEGALGFMRKTGIEEVWPHDYSHKRSGRGVLEEVAVRTIIAVLCDIVRQSEYEAERDRQNESEREYDRTMTEYYTHRGSGARTF